MSDIQTSLLYIGREPKENKGMVNPPVYRTSTIVYKSLDSFWADEEGIHTNKTYGRAGTPTSANLEKTMAELDGAQHAIVTSSGMSAIAITLFALLKPGDHIIASEAIYKCTQRLMATDMARYGVTVSFFDPSQTGQIEELIQPGTKLIYLENPGSATMEILDVPFITAIARKHKIVTVMDNTWASPLFYRPMDHGVDIVIQSLTKYVSGHSDYFAGVITCNANTYKELYLTSLNFGACATPDNCYLALRGLRTLYVRLKQHETSALKVARWLETQGAVSSVLHPALPSHPGHGIWKRDFQGSSGLFCFTVKTDKARLTRLMDSLKIFSIGLSWGGYESLLIPYDLNGVRNVTKNLLIDHYYFRINIGLENPDDLIGDLQQAFETLK